jgi:RHS repeat-associated protein
MFYEPNTGLYLTHYRAYDPVTARWLSRDPIEEHGGVNLYSYVSGNPASRTDPLGLCEKGGGHNPLLQLLEGMLHMSAAAISAIEQFFGPFITMAEMYGLETGAWNPLAFGAELVEWAENPSIQGYLNAGNSLALWAAAAGSEAAVALAYVYASAAFSYNFLQLTYDIAAQHFGSDAVNLFIDDPLGTIGDFFSNGAASVGSTLYHYTRPIWNFFDPAPAARPRVHAYVM